MSQHEGFIIFGDKDSKGVVYSLEHKKFWPFWVEKAEERS